MFKCETCRATFETPKTRDIRHAYEHETIAVCPECGEPDYYEAHLCECCGTEWISEADDYCDSCQFGLQKSLEFVQHSMGIGWDELLRMIEDVFID